jgi:hypothetical protein
LGTTFTGSINTAAQGYPPLIELMGIPEGYVPFGTTVIGYPAEIYHRVPLRKAVDVTYIESPDAGKTASRVSCAPGDLYSELKDS